MCKLIRGKYTGCGCVESKRFPCDFHKRTEICLTGTKVKCKTILGKCSNHSKSKNQHHGELLPKESSRSKHPQGRDGAQDKNHFPQEKPQDLTEPFLKSSLEQQPVVEEKGQVGLGNLGTLSQEDEMMPKLNPLGQDKSQGSESYPGSDQENAQLNMKVDEHRLEDIDHAVRPPGDEPTEREKRLEKELAETKIELAEKKGELAENKIKLAQKDENLEDLRAVVVRLRLRNQNATPSRHSVPPSLSDVCGPAAKPALRHTRFSDEAYPSHPQMSSAPFSGRDPPGYANIDSVPRDANIRNSNDHDLQDYDSWEASTTNRRDTVQDERSDYGTSRSREQNLRHSTDVCPEPRSTTPRDGGYSRGQEHPASSKQGRTFLNDADVYPTPSTGRRETYERYASLERDRGFSDTESVRRMSSSEHIRYEDGHGRREFFESRTQEQEFSNQAAQPRSGGAEIRGRHRQQEHHAPQRQDQGRPSADRHPQRDSAEARDPERSYERRYPAPQTQQRDYSRQFSMHPRSESTFRRDGVGYDHEGYPPPQDQERFFPQTRPSSTPKSVRIRETYSERRLRGEGD